MSFLVLSPHILYFLPFSGFIPRKAETQFTAVKEIHSISFVQCFPICILKVRIQFDVLLDAP